MLPCWCHACCAFPCSRGQGCASDFGERISPAGPPTPWTWHQHSLGSPWPWRNHRSGSMQSKCKMHREVLVSACPPTCPGTGGARPVMLDAAESLVSSAWSTCWGGSSLQAAGSCCLREALAAVLCRSHASILEVVLLMLSPCCSSRQRGCPAAPAQSS